jgi:hypothetical protein
MLAVDEKEMTEQKSKPYPTYEQAMLLKALVEVYKSHPLAIAELCDEHLCPNGSLLGIVREFANLARPR